MGGIAIPGIIYGGPGIDVSPTGEVSTGPGVPGMLYEAHLEVDVLISVAAPTPPNTFPPGQPVMLLSLPAIVLRGGPTLITASVSTFITNDDNTIEFGPFTQLQLWIDGAPVPFSTATLAFYWPNLQLPALVDAIETFGGIQRLVTLAPGLHSIELRWGVQGGAPAASAGVYAASGYDHASLVVQEV